MVSKARTGGHAANFIETAGKSVSFRKGLDLDGQCEDHCFHTATIISELLRDWTKKRDLEVEELCVDDESDDAYYNISALSQVAKQYPS